MTADPSIDPAGCPVAVLVEQLGDVPAPVVGEDLDSGAGHESLRAARPMSGLG